MRLSLRENVCYLLLRVFYWIDGRKKSLADYRPQDIKRILLISSTALGDTVLSTAAMVAMRRSFPTAQITCLISHNYVTLFRQCEFLDNVIPYYGGWRQFFHTIRVLRKKKPDLSLILHGNEPQATPLAYLSGARFIFKLPNANRFNFLLTNKSPLQKWSDLRIHGMQIRLAIAQIAGAEISGARMSLPITSPMFDYVENWLKKNGIEKSDIVIGFQTGASSQGRMWPAEHFIVLGKTLLEWFPDIHFVIMGANHERVYCQKIASAIGKAAIISASQIAVEALPALVSRCAVLVTGDTGPLHIAVAVSTPTVALFSVSNPTFSGAAYDFHMHKVIFRKSESDVRSKTDDPLWMKKISPQEVAFAVKKIINSVP